MHSKKTILNYFIFRLGLMLLSHFMTKYREYSALKTIFCHTYHNVMVNRVFAPMNALVAEMMLQLVCNQLHCFNEKNQIEK